MKLSLYLLLALPLCLAACDTVDEDGRFEGPLEVAEGKNVLLEDFTGQKCPNCPLAANEVSAMQAAYGADRLIAVSIHGGSLSVSEQSSAVGLANEQGNEYNTHWGIEAWPKGLVDRTGGVRDYTAWRAAVLDRFTVTPKVSLDLPALSYDPATRQVTLTAQVKSEGEAVSGKLTVWLTESDLVRPQLMPDGSANRDYVHNHVFRATVSAPYGDDMSLAAGEAQARGYTYTLRDDWTAGNMAVVLFYYNDADGVMQVIDSPLAGTAAH